jgi:tetratricopeptide (TPR) repeat protein
MAVSEDITTGVSFAKMGEYNESIVYFDKALAIDPDNTSALNNKGLALAKLGEYNESIAYFDKALAIDPTDAYSLNNKKSTLEEIK